MAPTGRRRRVLPIPRYSIEQSLRKLVKQFERDPTVGSVDMKLLTWYSSLVGGLALSGRRRHVVPIPRNSIENSFRKLVNKFERDPTVGSIDTNLLTRYSSLVGGMAPTGRRRRVVPFPRYSIKNSLWKLVKTL